ncbi:MAG: DUF805 domain-containing protein [Pseudomonadota bacterium]
MEQNSQVAAGRPYQPMRWLFFGISGRIGRVPYVLGLLFVIAVFGLLIAQLSAVDRLGARATFLSLCFVAFFFLAVWMVMAMSIKRLHDINIPGAVSVCLFVPAVSIIALLVMCAWRGTDGANDYGESSNRPKE